MGLKIKNCYIQKYDLTLPNAYAKLRTLVLNSNGTVNATFSIQQSREHCEKYQPIDVVRLDTENVWDRTIPLEKFAYEAAKTETNKITKYDPETHASVTVEEYGPLYGWEDDIV